MPLTVCNSQSVTQYKSEEIDVNKKSTPKFLISFRATNIQKTSTFKDRSGCKQGKL